MKLRSHGRRLATGIAVVAGMVVMAGQPVQATSALPPVAGKQLGQWTAIWWQWAWDQGFNEGPAFQAGSIDCSVGQTGKVWFLGGVAGDTGSLGGGGAAGRTCIDPIPADVRLFIPLVNVNLGNPDALCPPGNTSGTPGNCTIAQKRELVDSVLSDTVPGPFNSFACQLKAELDGKPVVFHGTPILRVQSPPFFLPALPPFLLADDAKVISDGYWVMLPPLKRGQHTLTLGGAFCDEDDPSQVVFGSQASYAFTVD